VGGTATQTLTLRVAQGTSNPLRFLQRSIHLAGPICIAEGQTDARATFALPRATAYSPPFRRSSASSTAARSVSDSGRRAPSRWISSQTSLR